MSLAIQTMTQKTSDTSCRATVGMDHAPNWGELLADGRGLRISAVLAVIVLHAGGNYAAVTLAPAMVAEVGGGELIGALAALFNITTVLAAAASGPLAARYGTKWLWWIMTGLALSGALLSAAAGTMLWIAVGRAVAGFGGGGLLALGFVALRSETSPAAFPKISAISGAFWIGAAFSGPLVGGLFADFLGWRPAFIVFGVGMLIYGFANARTMARFETERSTERFPITSFAAFGIGIGLISFAPQFDRGAAALIAFVGLIALTAAIWRERSHVPRMFPKRAFRFRTMQGSAIAAKTVLGASAMSILVFGPLVLTQVHGHSATFAGAFVLIETIGWSVASFAIVSIPGGRYVALAGPFLTLASLVGCYVFLIGGHLIGAALSIAACGFGLGMIWPFLGEQMVAGDLDGEKTKTMAMVSSVETLGFAIGGALVGLVGAFVAGGTIDDSASILRAASAGIMFSMPFALIGGVAAVRALRGRSVEFICAFEACAKRGEAVVTITRFPYEGLGRCEAVVSDGLVYAVATDPHCADGILAQTRNALDELSSILEKAGSGRPGLLQATVFLSDVKQKQEMDTIWIDWIGPKTNWPQRACVGVDLEDGCLIEIVVTAKVLRSSPQ